MKIRFVNWITLLAFAFAMTAIDYPALAITIGHEIPKSDYGVSLTIDEAVQRSLKDDASLKQARERLLKEESLYKGKIAEFFPKFGTEGFQGVATGDKKSVTFFDTYVDQPLFMGGKSLAEKRRQKARVENETLKVEQVKADVEISMRVIYVKLLEEKELTRIAQGQVNELGTHLKRVEILFNSEAIPRIEVMKAESLLQGARNALVKHKEMYDYYSAVLREAIGLAENEALDLEPLRDIVELESGFEQYLEDTRQKDPIYRIKALEVEEKAQEKRILQAERFPQISLASKWNLHQDVYVDTNRFVFGVMAKWNIWDFGRLGSQINAKAHEIEETKWAGKAEIQRREKELRRLFHEARSAREKIRLNEVLRNEREEQYKNEKAKHIVGQKGVDEILDAWIAREVARMDWVKAVSEYRIIMVHLSHGERAI